MAPIRELEAFIRAGAFRGRGCIEQESGAKCLDSAHKLVAGCEEGGTRRKPLMMLVPVEGLEPPLPCENQILSLARLPFRHTGTGGA